MAGQAPTPQQGPPVSIPTTARVSVVHITDRELLSLEAMAQEHNLPIIWTLARELRAMRNEYLRQAEELGRMKARIPAQYDFPPVVTKTTDHT